MKQEEVLAKSGWMSSAQAARLLKRTVYTIYRLIKKGEIDGLRLGGHWYVKQESLKAYFLKDAERGGEEQWNCLLEMKSEP